MLITLHFSHDELVCFGIKTAKTTLKESRENVASEGVN